MLVGEGGGELFSILSHEGVPGNDFPDFYCLNSFENFLLGFIFLHYGFDPDTRQFFPSIKYF